MGLLADVFSYGDGLKRKMRGLLEDPAGTVDLGARRFNEDQGGLLNLFANAYPMGGDKTVLNTPEQRKQMQAEAASKALETYGGLLGATVWHGSPHKFNKFDSSKIGTGEGAQAYGHGLYLAEAPEVAGQYARMNLAGPANVAHVASRDGGDALSALKKVYPGMPAQWYESAMLKAKEVGNTYKVDLPDNAIAKMLDWDKPLSQQAPEVRKAVLATKKQLTPDDIENLGGAAGVRALYDPASKIDNFLGTWQSLRGRPDSGESLLRQQGITGIRYLDGGSRGADTGTSNYVVFPGNEGLLQILERNGSPIP